MNFSLFEAIMLICFGFSWPFAIIKTIKVKNPTGKSYLFLGLVILGYVSGCLHKLFYKYDFVFWLYLLNGVLVATDTLLCVYYQYRNNSTQPSENLIKTEM